MSQIVAILFLIAGIVGGVPVEFPHRGSLAWALVFVAGLLMVIGR